MFKAAFVAAICASSVSASPYSSSGRKGLGRLGKGSKDLAPCGADQQPICKGSQMQGRESECDFGSVPTGYGICIDIMAHTSNDHTSHGHADDHSNSHEIGDTLPIDGYEYSDNGDDTLEYTDNGEFADSEEPSNEATDDEVELDDELEATNEDEVEDTVEDEVEATDEAEEEAIHDVETPVTCGALDLPVCSGDDMIGRMYECDFGYHGYDGICIKYEDYLELTKAAEEPEVEDDMLPTTHSKDGTHSKKNNKKSLRRARKEEAEPEEELPEEIAEQPVNEEVDEVVDEEVVETDEDLADEEVDEVVDDEVVDEEVDEVVDDEVVEDEEETVDEDDVDEAMEDAIEDGPTEEDTEEPEEEAEDVVEVDGSTLNQSTDDCGDSGAELSSCAIARAVATPQGTDTFEFEQGNAEAEAEATFTGQLDA